ncbi:28S ribosomal protein S28, mitochondrial [Sitodiplosis mosellana]|uniref:28S ribosomal protein S28, mitochondrial n=1 Tax=Sitodiplosis mosellana TaxID=263140 RepID=UPI00244487C0|nr:28S ribosomal protein S28, mitochondrial [Sitodiplosis mosellana]
MLARIVKSVQTGSVALRQYPRAAVYVQIKHFSDKADNETVTNSSSEEKLSDKLGSFAKAFKEFEQINEKKDETPVHTVPFKKLLRQSKLVDLGDPLNKIVSGKIVHTVGDDLYIDFGWKFNCVCVRPGKNGELYVRNAKVKLQIKELELSSRFLGEDKDLTILEADCKLLGLISSPKSQKKTLSSF